MLSVHEAHTGNGRQGMGARATRPRLGGWVRFLLVAALVPCQPTPGSAQTLYTVFPAKTPDKSATAVSAATRQDVRVTLSVQDSTIAYALRELVHQAHLRLSFNSSNPLFARRVTVRVANAKIMDAFATVLRGTGLGARLAMDGTTVLISSRAESSGERGLSQSGVVAGRVTDSASGKGVGGATVAVQGTALKTTSAESGQFVLREVPAGEQVLRVRAFGYKPATQTVTVVDSERVSVQVVLRPAPTVLSGVVTTATGVQQRQQVGNDITVLNADSIQRITPVSTLTDLLENHVPGLTVLRESGIPGAPRRVRLRGTSSIERSNDPILIVDGIRVNADQSGQQANVQGYFGPSPLDQIDPNSIETIEVFKGPSASAMYGAEAGNGVIVVTTKRGRAGKTRWNLVLDGGESSLPSGGYPLNTFRFGHYFGDRSYNFSHLCFVTQLDCAVQDSVVRYQALNDPRFNVFSHGRKHNVSLTVSGGTGSLTYALTGSASHESGLFQLPAIEAERFLQQHGFPAPGWMRHPDQYDTWGGNSTLDLPLTNDGAKVSLLQSYFQSQQQQSSLQNAIGTLLGRYIDTTQLSQQPLIPTYYTRALMGSGTFTTGVTLHWPVKGWLPLDATAGLNAGTNDNRMVLPKGYDFTSTDSAGGYQMSQGQSLQQTLNGGTTVLVPRRGVMPAARIPIGFNWTAQQTQLFGAGTNILPPGVLDPTTFVYGNNSGPTQNRVRTTTYGWYVAPTLDLNSRFFMSPGIRFDGGSASGAHGGINGGNFSPFPKLDFSWLAINQPEQPVLGAITLLRPRVAFGIAGVQPDPTSQYRLLTQGTFVGADGSVAPVALVGSYGNTKLVPERSRELEGGFDTELWNQRLTLTLTGYHKLRYNAIVTSPLAPSVGNPVGFSTGPVNTIGGEYTYNVGTVLNNGVNAAVGARLLDWRAALWQVNANISKNTNKLLTLAPGVVSPPPSGGDNVNRLVPGYPLNGLWARPIVSYIDVNQNGRIDPGEVRLADSAVFLGAPEPNYQLTLSTTLSLFNGRLSVNTAADYQNGLTQTYSVAANPVQDQYNAFTSALNDPATPLSQQAAIVASCTISPANACSSIGLAQVVNMLRWTSLSVNYTVPSALTRPLRVNAMSVALQGSNLGLHTNYRGKDPNVGASPGNNTIADTGQLPQPRLWQLRITLGN